MIWQLDLMFFVLLIGSATVAVRVRSITATVAVLALFSLFVALLFAGMGAPDVAFVEAVLGSAFVGVLLLVAVLVTGDRPAGRDRRAVLFAGPLVVAFAGLLLVASVDLPDRGDPDAPAALGVAAQYVERSLDDSETPNVVTAVLADYRSLDTLGETIVVFTAALSAALVLARRRADA
ncbi:MAG TPA: hydrogen gas-evolving membrane-bound hydrogenase subunit E [Acidimicrobiales bacterium]|nr:hydrogen gas-evolving membrane-bound hydrogenase subunit E [Acidimicrobiales bacterium]